MPYYHSFGWYYFAKYIFGLAGMIYLYTGIFKEKSIVCPCPAEERQLQQRKESNNECSSTGDQSDAPVQISCCAQTLGLADVKNENGVRCRGKTKRESAEKGVGTSRKNLRSKYTACEHNRREKSTRGSDRRLKIREGDGRGRNVDRGLQCQRSGKEATTRVKCTGGSELEKRKEEEDRRILDAVARAKIRARSSFAEQENLELEAFVRSIVDREISRKCLVVGEKISTSSEISSTIEMEDSEDSELQSSSNETRRFPKHRATRRRMKQPLCKKHFPQSPTTSLTSVRSRSGTPYFTASSRGKKRPECKIHGNRFRNKVQYERPRKQLLRPRIVECSDESEREKKPLRSTVDRRKISSRRITRYRSSIVFTL
ncbi:uncharacterized protein [Venturia canescens]|uniref:uncharacterized protein isoform X1 n=1 Tax=Venturia canescens TaxID=32260 RepID=UPI001C9BC38B|nr:uncharacterized protein LOC122412269 isoform X1 [Venturia canescens]